MSLHQIQHIKYLSKNTYVVRMDRNDLQFRAGQYIQVGIPDDEFFREYSIYSSEQDEYIEILVKQIKKGYFTNKLSQLNPGDQLEVNGPFGEFTLNEDHVYSSKFLFIATGTGIAPFHSMVESYPGLDYKIIHGVSYESEVYGKAIFNADQYKLYKPRELKKNYIETLTNHLANSNIEVFTLFYLCGNQKLISEGIEVLKEKGIRRGQFHVEIFY